ncbi:MAG: hypothetical protein HYY13_09720 [Nitrospirae bacterium]|nr:hypothetical protein [Nitrospirota bacterium]
MAPAGGSERRSRLYGGWSAMAVFAFIVLLLLSLLTGACLEFHNAPDSLRYTIVRLHNGISLLAAPVALLVTAVHLRRLVGWRAAILTAAAGLSFIVFLLLPVPANTAFMLGALAVFLLALRVVLNPAPHGRSSMVNGSTAFMLLILTLASGFYVGGPFKSIGSEPLHLLHRYSGLLAWLPVLFHILRNYPVRRTRFAAAAGVLGSAVILLSIGFIALERRGAGVSSGASRRPDRLKAGSTVESLPSFYFESAESCGGSGCHSEIYKQWSASLHRYSASNVAYQNVLRVWREETGRDAALCERCHNPAAGMFTGADGKLVREFEETGVSCVTCHLVHEADAESPKRQRRITVPTIYLPDAEDADPARRRAFIGEDLRAHRNSYGHPSHQEAEFCLACHAEPVTLDGNDGEPPGPYPSWKRSSFPTEGIRCMECHLQLHPHNDPESMEKLGSTRADHRMFGIQTALSATLQGDAAGLEEVKDFEAESRRWLRGELEVSTFMQILLWVKREPSLQAYTKYFARRPLLDLELDSIPDPADASRIMVGIRTTNSRIGHEFPVAMFDLADIWLHLRVTDARGGVLYEDGAPPPSDRPVSARHRLGAVLRGDDGRPVDRHRIWAASSLTDKLTLEPGKALHDRVVWTLPSSVAGPYRIEARWFYRRYNDRFVKWLYANPADAPPPIVLSEASLSVAVP